MTKSKVASSFVVAFVASVSLLACSKSSSPSKSAEPTGAGKTAVAAAASLDLSKFGGACKSSMDCPHTSFDSSCSVECEKPSDAESGYCQLRNIVATAKSACVGNRRGVERSGSVPTEKTPVLNYCDMNAGVFCSDAHVCEAVKAVGAACKSSDECGVDGACAKSVCVAAGAPGAAAVESRCDSKSYREGEQCVARKADGEKCGESDQCKSLSCGGTCNASKPETCELK
jgi:hypothetical protein